MAMSINKDIANTQALFRDLANGMDKGPDQRQEKQGSVLDRALDRLAERAAAQSGPSNEIPASKPPQDRGLEM
jgi:hypothetical protein